MFKFSQIKNRRQYDALEQRLTKHFAFIWGKMSFIQRWRVSRKIFHHLEEKHLFKLFMNGLLILKNKLPETKKNNEEIEEYFFFNLVTHLKWKKNEESQLLLPHIQKEAIEIQNKTVKNLLQKQKWTWKNKKNLAKKEKNGFPPNMFSSSIASVLGNFYVLLLAQKFKNKSDINQWQKRAYEFGFSLGMYLLSHYQIWKKYYSQKFHRKKYFPNLEKNQLFFAKLFFCKSYIDQLQFFFPMEFNQFAREINRSLGL